MRVLIKTTLAGGPCCGVAQGTRLQRQMPFAPRPRDARWPARKARGRTRMPSDLRATISEAVRV